MAYQVSPRKNKINEVYWQLYWREYKGNKAKWRYIPQDEYRALGFEKSWSVEQAKAHSKFINNRDKFLKIEAKRQSIQAKLKVRDFIESVFLPNFIVAEFEQVVILERIGRGKEEALKYKSTRSHWRTAKEIVRDMHLDPSEWYERKERLYIEFEKRRMSIAYVEKVIRLLNEWGYFYCKRMKLAWEKVPRPQELDRKAISKANRQKKQAGTESDPMSLEQLKICQQKLLKQSQRDWVTVAFWFGLRPIECDRLGLAQTPEKRMLRAEDGHAWAVTNNGDVDILKIYQTKLEGKIENIKKVWKSIPVVEVEQKEALKIILAIDEKQKADPTYTWKRPLTKSIKKALDSDGVNAYGPRKNFYSMMKQRNYLAEDIARWMGHTDLRTTIDAYENREIVTYKKAS